MKEVWGQVWTAGFLHSRTEHYFILKLQQFNQKTWKLWFLLEIFIIIGYWMYNLKNLKVEQKQNVEQNNKIAIET